MNTPSIQGAMKLIADIPEEDLGLVHLRDDELGHLTYAALLSTEIDDTLNRAQTVLQVIRTAYLLGRDDGMGALERGK